MPEPEFRVLGSVEARVGGRLVPVSGKSLTAIGGLLLFANRFVTIDAVTEWIWGQDLPAHPRAALHNTMSRLRHLFGQPVFETLPGGYQLVTDAEHLDLLQFERLTGAAVTATRHGAEQDAADRLAEALSLWRGPPFSNLPSSSALSRDAIGRLTEKYLNALQMRAQLCLKLGQHDAAISELSENIYAHPLHEPLAGLLMLALVRSGRRADALNIFETVRRALREELGIDPGVALQGLHTRILRGGLELDEIKASRMVGSNRRLV